MPQKVTEEPVSLRHGKLYPSQRFADVAAKDKALRTNWRLGPDAKPLYQSNMRASQIEVEKVPPEVLALRQPRVLKNSSDKVIGAITLQEDSGNMFGLLKARLVFSFKSRLK
jgi:hypothetical protein